MTRFHDGRTATSGDRRDIDQGALRIPYHESVIYKAHVKGMTARHPAILEDERGTYAGLSRPR